MSDLCLKNVNKGVGIFSPCLKEKEHLGDCVHVLLCCEPCCFCGGFEGKLVAFGFFDRWSELKRLREKVSLEMRSIREKITEQAENQPEVEKK